MIKLTIDNVSYDAPLTTKVMHDVAMLWKKNALQMLRRQGHKATGALANSIKVKWDVNQKKDEWSTKFIASGKNRPDNSKYGHKEIKETLFAMSHNKCFYCLYLTKRKKTEQGCTVFSFILKYASERQIQLP